MTFIKSFPKLNLTASLAPSPRQIPLAIKLAFTAFMAVLVPVYWKQYGPTNFLYFCDLALFITLAATGLGVQFGLQAAINMASTVQLIPAKGMTLPFISYGGSSALAMAICVGMLLSLTREHAGLREAV